MPPLKSFLYSNLLVSTGAVAGAVISRKIAMNHAAFSSCLLETDCRRIYETNTLLISLFLFSSTFCLYHFHEWFLTKEAKNTPRGQWILGNKKQILISIFLSAIASLFLFYFLPKKAQGLSLPVVFFSLLYTAPKIPLPFFIRLRALVRFKTIYLSVVWTFATTILPLEHLTSANLFYILTRFITFYTICFLFDFRDRVYDQKSGVPSYIHSLSHKNAEILLLALLGINLVSTGLLLYVLPFSIVISHWIPFPILFYYRKVFLYKSDDLYFYGYLDTLAFIGPLLSIIFL